MARPRTEPRDRTSTAIRFRPELHAALVAAAAERDLSINWLVNRAVEEFLARLLPVDQMVITAPHGGRP